jgi:hypothetical protein
MSPEKDESETGANEAVARDHTILEKDTIIDMAMVNPPNHT